MIAYCYISGVQTMYASFLQSFEFLEGVNMTGCRFSIQLHFNCIKAKCFIGAPRYKYSNLCIGWVQELFLELVQRCGNGHPENIRDEE